MKICVVCSHGGHFTETQQILEAFSEHELFLVTYHSSRETDVSQIAPTYFTDNIGTNIFRMGKAMGWALKILLKERPDIIVSMGAEIALPFFYLGKLLGIKTIFIESWCRVENLSKTGKLLSPIADLFLVQWPQLLDVCHERATYQGAVI